MLSSKLMPKFVEKWATRLLAPIDKLAYRRFYDYPFGKQASGAPDVYLQLWEAARRKSYPLVDDYEREAGHAMEADWLHRLALATQVVIKNSDICYQHGRLLYAALSRYVASRRPRSLNILETGTARGFSSLCMARALADAGQAGKIFTFDVLPHNTKMFWNCISDQHGPQTRAELMRDYRTLADEYIVFHQGDTKRELDKMHLPRVHFAFLDGMHTYEYALHEFDYLKGRQVKGDVVFFDDYSTQVFPGIVKAVDEICAKNGYAKKVITLSEQRGYVIAEKG